MVSRWRTGLSLVLAVTLVACARPAAPPSRAVETPPADTVEPAPTKPSGMAAPATVKVDHRFGDGWRPLSLLASYAPPGPTEIRFVFSKPVRRAEVEQALIENQPAPVRGLMQWQDDQTLYWQISELPARVDFFLTGASDQEGVPLPGGIPSLRAGEPPRLVELSLATAGEQVRADLPPDIVTASLSPERKQMNLLAWVPGANRWDWQTRNFHLTLADGALQPGRVEGAQPRIPDDLEGWVISPNGTLVAGLRTERRSPPDQNPYRANLVILDLRGGRQVVYEDFIGRYMGTTNTDLSAYLAWSPDGGHVAALSYTGQAGTSDLVVLDVAAGAKATVATALPVPAYGARLAWSADRRYLLAANVLLDLEAKSHRVLAGGRSSHGIWEPGGNRLLYSPEDWGPVFVVDSATGTTTQFGNGMVVDWAAQDKVYLIRWPSSGARYQPPGM